MWSLYSFEWTSKNKSLGKTSHYKWEGGDDTLAKNVEFCFFLTSLQHAIFFSPSKGFCMIYCLLRKPYRVFTWRHGGHVGVNTNRLARLFCLGIEWKPQITFKGVCKAAWTSKNFWLQVSTGFESCLGTGQTIRKPVMEGGEGARQILK